MVNFNSEVNLQVNLFIRESNSTTIYTRVPCDLTYYATQKFYSPKHDFIMYLMHHASLFFERPDYIRLTSS